MKIAAPVILLLFIVALGIWTVNLSNKMKELQDQIGRLQSDGQTQRNQMQQEIDTGIAQLDERVEGHQSLLQVLEGGSEAHQTRIGTLEGDTKSNQEKIGSLEDRYSSIKEDVAKRTRSLFLRNVANEVAEWAMSDKSLVSDPHFVNAVADVLAKEFSEELKGDQGKPGLDASNQKVADMLKHDAEFLDIVSVSLLLNEDGASDKQGIGQPQSDNNE